MASKIAVTFVSHVGVVGGAEKSLLDLIQALDRDAFELRAIVPALGELGTALEERGVPTQVCPGLRRLHRSGPFHRRLTERVGFVRGAWQLLRCLQRHPADILHANTTTAALFSLWATRRLGIPLVWHQRDLAPLGRWARLLDNASARIVVPSVCALRQIEETLAEGERSARAVHIPNGIATADFESPARSTSSDELDLGAGPVVLSVAQLVPWKGHGLLIDAAAEVHERRPDARFLLAGADRFENDGLESALRARIDQLGLGDVVRLLGQRDDVRQLLAGADVFAHAAFPEPFGRVVVEAMASARPVVALAGRHGPAEIVRDGVDGILVQPPTASAFARAVLELIEDPDRAQAMGVAGRERAREHFDRRLVGQRCGHLYRQLLSSGEDGGQEVVRSGSGKRRGSIG